MKEDGFTVYCPDRSQKAGFLNIWKEMCSDLIKGRELIRRFFIRDFTSRYRQTFFGVLWAFIIPVTAVIIFFFLTKSGIVNTGEMDIPYSVYVFFGITIWTFFSSGISSMANSIVEAGGMIQQINFPRISLAISSVGHVLVDFLIRLILLIIVFFVFKIVPSWTVIFFPLVIFPLFLLTLGLGFLLAIFSAIIRDISRLAGFALAFLMLISPVAYPIPRGGILANINVWNPLAHILNASRDIVFKGNISNPQEFFLSSILAIFIFLFGWIVFHIGQMKIAERI